MLKVVVVVFFAFTSPRLATSFGCDARLPSPFGEGVGGEVNEIMLQPNFRIDAKLIHLDFVGM
jgi:hypothetical protein